MANQNIKVNSITFLTSVDKVPERSRDTEFNRFIMQISEALKNPQAKLGLKLATQNAKKWQRYAIQKKLQNMGHKIVVSSGADGYFFIVPVK